MYGISEYLIALHQAEKARVADPARRDRRKAEPPPIPSQPPSRSKCAR